MNAPDRELSYVLEEDEIKVVIKEDPKLINAVKLTIVKEDHTVGTLLRTELLKNSQVRFAGYRMPLSLENLLELKLQTSGAIEPMEALKKATDDRIDQVSAIQNAFIEEVEKHQNYSFN